MSSNMKLTRRGFLSGAASIGLGSTLGTNALLSSCVDKDKDKQILLHPINELYIPELPDNVPEVPLLHLPGLYAQRGKKVVHSLHLMRARSPSGFPR